MTPNGDNLNDIISSLTPDDINMLKGVASSILGNQSEPAQASAPQSQSADKSADSAPADMTGLGLDNIDFNMLMKAKAIFDKMNNTPNKNVDLINALKPHLRPETRDKADQALKIIKLFEVLPLLRELF